MALRALLEFFDEEPQLARLCIVHSNSPVPAISVRRLEILRELTRVIDAGVHAGHGGPPTLTAEGIVGGTLAVIDARVVEPQPEGLTELLNPLMNFIARPYRGARAARRELHRPLRAAPRPRRPIAEPLPSPWTNVRMTYRTMRVLSAIAARPGLSNIQVGKRAGIGDQGQTSRLLNRLAGLGLVENTGEGQLLGGANAWHLTREGQRLTQNVARVSLNDAR